MSKAASEWFGFACAAMVEARVKVSDARVALRMEQDTGVKITKSTVRTHRMHSGDWAAVVEALGAEA